MRRIISSPLSPLRVCFNGRACRASLLPESVALRPRKNHELDGFVHHDAHRPFALPDDADRRRERMTLGSLEELEEVRASSSFIYIFLIFFILVDII